MLLIYIIVLPEIYKKCLLHLIQQCHEPTATNISPFNMICPNKSISTMEHKWHQLEQVNNTFTRHNLTLWCIFHVLSLNMSGHDMV